MSKEVLMKKGYTLEVTSWENDADNYKTKSVYCGDNKEDAKALLKLCKELFSSHPNGIGIGNMMAYDYENAIVKTQEYLVNNPNELKAVNKYYVGDLNIELGDDVQDRLLNDFNFELMGSSEYYCSRVFDKGRIIYTSEDILIEVVEEIDRYGNK